jgi:hypothetical protein
MVRIKGEVISVGTGKPTKIDDHALMNKNMVKERLGIDVEIRYGQKPKGDKESPMLIKRLLELNPRPLPKGLNGNVRMNVAHKNSTEVCENIRINNI